MVKLKPQDFETSTPSPVNHEKLLHAKTVLIFGPDDTRKRNLCQKLISAHQSQTPDITIERLSSDTIASPDTIFDALTQSDFLSPHKLLIFDITGQGAQLFKKDLCQALETLNAPHPAILMAGDLKPTSPLRKWAEKTTHTLSFACYEPSPAEQSAQLSSRLSEAGINAEADTVSLLSQTLSNAHLNLDQTIELIKLFTEGEGGNTFTSEHYAILFEPEESSAKNFALAKALRQEKAILKTDERDLILAIMKLKSLIDIAENNTDISEQTVRTARPPIHFSEQKAALRVLKTYSHTQLVTLLRTLSRTLFAARQNHTYAQHITATLNVDFKARQQAF